MGKNRIFFLQRTFETHLDVTVVLGKIGLPGFLVGKKIRGPITSEGKGGAMAWDLNFADAKNVVFFFQGIVGCAPTNVPLWETPI